MKIFLYFAVAILLAAASTHSQSKPNDTVSRQLKTLGAESTITLSHDLASNMSKLMAVSGNFSDSEAKAADVRAMNFAAGFLYPGQSLEKSPDPILLTFWVLSKQNRFGNGHALLVQVGDQTLDLGESRYVARPRDGMEYLNFNLSRDVLARISSGSDVRFMLGGASFTFSRDQLKMLANLLLLSDTTYDK
jgi:hypothetical protein